MTMIRSVDLIYTTVFIVAVFVKLPTSVSNILFSGSRNRTGTCILCGTTYKFGCHDGGDAQDPAFAPNGYPRIETWNSTQQKETWER